MDVSPSTLVKLTDEEQKKLGSGTTFYDLNPILFDSMDKDDILHKGEKFLKEAEQIYLIEQEWKKVISELTNF